MTAAALPAGSLVHASCVAVPTRTLSAAPVGVLIRGAPGAGKSTLALRLIALGATLVADDQTELSRRAEAVIATAPSRLCGLIEARGVGLLRMTPMHEVALGVIVDLGATATPPTERLPVQRIENLFDVSIPVISLTESDRTAAVVYSLAAGGVLVDPEAAVRPDA